MIPRIVEAVIITVDWGKCASQASASKVAPHTVAADSAEVRMVAADNAGPAADSVTKEPVAQTGCSTVTMAVAQLIVTSFDWLNVGAIVAEIHSIRSHFEPLIHGVMACMPPPKIMGVINGVLQ